MSVKKKRLASWRDAAPSKKVSMVVQALLAGLAIVVALLGITGVWESSGELFRNLVLFAVGIVLGTLLVDNVDREVTRGVQTSLIDSVRSASGQLGVKEVPAGDIGSGLDLLLRESQDWTFRGGSGRYLRHSTLPRLALEKGPDVPVAIQILDPRDGDLCAAYANYRRKQRAERESRENEGDAKTILHDLLAIIYSAAWHTANKRMTASVILLRSFSPLRYDIGSQGLYVTVADRTLPGLYAKRGTWYYQNILDEMLQAVHGHPSVELDVSSASGVEQEEIEADDVRRCLEATTVVEGLTKSRVPLLGGDLDAKSVDFMEIAGRVFPDESPY